MTQELYQGDPTDDRSLLFWAAMRDPELCDKLVALGFIHKKGEGDDASYVWKSMYPDLLGADEAIA